MAPTGRREDGRLWAIALGLSLVVNGCILLAAGFVSLSSKTFERKSPVSTTAVANETVVTIFPTTATPSASAGVAVAPAGKTHFSRTTADQASSTVVPSTLMGERNTRATSDRASNPNAAPLPSQAGIDPRNPDELETTASDYQDGSSADQPTTDSQELPTSSPHPPSPDSTVADPSPPADSMNSSANHASQPTPTARAPLLDGPNPVDVFVPRNPAEKENFKPTPAEPLTDGSTQTAATQSPTPKPAPTQTENPHPFQGYQRKTAIVGSISRTGRSALDVTDSPLGRYQAIVSRAVEQEWQRNCVRHRDFITPGFLTVRFFVEASGRVRTVQFVGDMETGEVQKGFTLNSIRDANLPPMPNTLKKDFEKEPLEMIFNFYF